MICIIMGISIIYLGILEEIGEFNSKQNCTHTKYSFKSIFMISIQCY